MDERIENVVNRKRGSRGQLSLDSNAEYNSLPEVVIRDCEQSSRFREWTDRVVLVLCLLLSVTMNTTKTVLIGVAILVCLVVVIVLFNLGTLTASSEDGCIKLNGEETSCYAKNENPYRLYGTKTVYEIVRGKNEFSKLNVEGCVPKVFYLFCRHATRYPDKEDIEEMIELLPDLQKKILNNSLKGEVKMCQEDVDNLKNWVEALKPEYDNQMSDGGRVETILLAQRFKKQFPSLLGISYSPEKFKFEFTSRERTRTTAEAFAEGLFGDDSKRINFENNTNDVLQFHKDCKAMQKRCKDKSYDTSEVDKFEKGHLLQKVIDSISARIGVPLTYGDVKIIMKSCVFGYALNTSDVWCSLLTTDEMQVIELGEDIDDYYKDAYGNKVNYEQACPVLDYIMDLFKMFTNTSESKALLQFSHAGGVKKVYSMFGLFEDEEKLVADKFCSQRNRKWQSSYIAPFTTNLALVLYDCGTEKKIAAFHNEKPIKLKGCSDMLCSYQEFYKMYNPIAENCSLKDICCTCCVN